MESHRCWPSPHWQRRRNLSPAPLAFPSSVPLLPYHHLLPEHGSNNWTGRKEKEEVGALQPTHFYSVWSKWKEGGWKRGSSAGGSNSVRPLPPPFRILDDTTAACGSFSRSGGEKQQIIRQSCSSQSVWLKNGHNKSYLITLSGKTADLDWYWGIFSFSLSRALRHCRLCRCTT